MRTIDHHLLEMMTETDAALPHSVAIATGNLGTLCVLSTSVGLTGYK